MGKVEYTVIIIMVTLGVLIASAVNTDFTFKGIEYTSKHLKILESMVNSTKGSIKNSDVIVKSKDGYTYKVYYDYVSDNKVFEETKIYFIKDSNFTNNFIKLEKYKDMNLTEDINLLRNIHLDDGKLTITNGKLYYKNNNIWKETTYIEDTRHVDLIMLKNGNNYVAFNIIKPNNGYILDKYATYVSDNIMFLYTDSDTLNVDVSYGNRIETLDKTNNKVYLDSNPTYMNFKEYVMKGKNYKVRLICLRNNKKLVDKFINITTDGI